MIHKIINIKYKNKTTKIIKCVLKNISVRIYNSQLEVSFNIFSFKCNIFSKFSNETYSHWKILNVRECYTEIYLVNEPY